MKKLVEVIFKSGEKKRKEFDCRTWELLKNEIKALYGIDTDNQMIIYDGRLIPIDTAEIMNNVNNECGIVYIIEQ
jgi:hypothetical protein